MEHVLTHNSLSEDCLKRPRADCGGGEDKAVRCRNDGCDFLASSHAHPVDNRVSFDEASHIYEVDGERVCRSCTDLLHDVFPDTFDPRLTVDTYYDRWKETCDPRYAGIQPRALGSRRV